MSDAEKTAAEILEELEQAEAPKKATHVPGPKDHAEYSFDFEHTDSRGKVWRGHFTNHILTIRERRLSKVMKAKMLGGIPVEAIDREAWEVAEMLSHLSLSLNGTKEPPEWAKDFEKLQDPRILEALYSEVSSHEDTFFRRNPNP